jgi:hypothetical protein
MKRVLIPAIAMLIAVVSAHAQEVFKKGDLVFNAGVGINNSIYSGTGYSNTIPPISISGEYGIKDNLIMGKNGSIGVGGYLGYTSAKHTVINNYGFDYSSFIIGARGAFHYEFVKKLDTYAGVMLGYNIVSSDVFGTETGGASASASAFEYSLFLGGRYWFSSNFGAFAEVGYGITNFSVGLSLKL